MLSTKNLELLITEDGSHTIRVPELDESYHSSHGAIQESNHVFIKNGLNYWVEEHKLNKLKVFEVGFGTGLNALLTTLFAQERKLFINYHGIELNPVDQELIYQLNYSEQLKSPPSIFSSIHEVPWEKAAAINPHFKLLKQKASFLDFTSSITYDVVYFDAFAPSKQPELWEFPVLEKCYRMLNKNGLLVTYSAKGELKRNLNKAGFKVETLPGPPGKWEMVRAIK